MKYIEILNQTAEETAKSNNELIAESANIQMQSAILNTKKEIAKKEAYINTLKQSRELNVSAIVIASNELALAKREQEQLIALQTELF